jgi:uncharacterized protein (UPF0147 family)
MDSELSPPLPPAATDSSTPPALAERTPGATAATLPAGSPAFSGFIPGQTEEERMEAKRNKWKDQKRRQRLAKLAATGGLPPALPARIVPAGNADLPPAGPVDGRTDAADAAGAVAAVALVEWTPDEIAEITDELIEALDEHDKSAAGKAATMAKLEISLVREIEEDAAMPLFCKRIFKKCVPKLTARALNATGVSSEHKDGGFIALAVLYYLYSKFSNKKRLKDLIAKANGQPGASQPEKKS